MKFLYVFCEIYTFQTPLADGHAVMGHLEGRELLAATVVQLRVHVYGGTDMAHGRATAAWLVSLSWTKYSSRQMIQKWMYVLMTDDPKMDVCYDDLIFIVLYNGLAIDEECGDSKYSIRSKL